MDAGLLLELLEDGLIHIVIPVVDVDHLVGGQSAEGHHGGQQGEEREQGKQLFHGMYLLYVQASLFIAGALVDQ